MSQSSAAQEQVLYEAAGPGTEAEAASGAAALRRVASERLAAHRERRAAAQSLLKAQVTAAAERQAQARSQSRAQAQQGSSRVREAVAARYEKSVSYREFLAQEAAIALEKARAEAEIAARNVQAVAAVQTQLLEEIEQWKQAPAAADRDEFTHAMADIALAATESLHLRGDVASIAATASKPAELTVRLYEDLRPQASPGSSRRLISERHIEHDAGFYSSDMDAELDAEIAFRLAPEFEPAPTPASFTGNVIEFPRPLVAARKARPRLAEGPLLAEGPPPPQLRIFEVEPDQISSVPTVEEQAPAHAPGWQSLVLDASPHAHAIEGEAAAAAPALTLHPARLSLRLMAAAVDAVVIATAFVAAASAAVALCPATLRMLPLPLLAASAAGLLSVLTVIYPLLFFTFAEATPGMRYARVALCTFAETSPTRSAARRRIFATLLAASPVGLGLIWAWMDDDHLGWHDRISRMYPREY